MHVKVRKWKYSFQIVLGLGPSINDVYVTLHSKVKMLWEGYKI